MTVGLDQFQERIDYLYLFSFEKSKVLLKYLPIYYLQGGLKMAEVNKMTIRQRLLAVLHGRKPDRIPLISRVDFWYNGLKYQNKLPPDYQNLSLAEVHRKTGFGQEEWFFPCSLRLRGAELIIKLEGHEIFHQTDPEVTNFPSLWGMIPSNRPGTSDIEIITPVGRIMYRQKLLVESLESGAWRPMTVIHPIRDISDYQTFEYLLEHAEFVPRYEDFFKRESEIGEGGFLVPMLNRTPFQALLLDALGEINMFYALHDNPVQVERLHNLLDEVNCSILKSLADFNVPYIEFCENVDVSMANPGLFKKYILPAYQSYSAILHSQNKMLGAHTDGNLKGLLPLLSESGLDVCESFTPAPMTACTFEEAWQSWQNGPLLWGGIPSCYLEARFSEENFHKRVDEMLALIGSKPVILGIADAVMPDNLIDRLAWLVERVESYQLDAV
jgi:hypothetical protein